MTASLIDWPQLRTAPVEVVRELRSLDPTMEIVYRGEGRWTVGRVRPNQLRRKQAEGVLTTAFSVLSVGKRFNARSKDKIEWALMALQGFSPIQDYYGEPDSSVVNDIRMKLWMLEHTSDDQFFRHLEEGREKAQQSAHNEMTDSERAKFAWKYAFTRSHTVTRLDDPHKQALQVPTGRTRHATITTNPKVA